MVVGDAVNHSGALVGREKGVGPERYTLPTLKEMKINWDRIETWFLWLVAKLPRRWFTENKPKNK
jgi:hypothetical protein